MYRWNPVQDFVNQFTRQRRIQRWTKEKTQKLLVKAVHRYKDVCLYDERDIRMKREREWCELKKENLMRLAVWEYDRKQQLPKGNEQLSIGQVEDDTIIDITDNLANDMTEDHRSEKSSDNDDVVADIDDELNNTRSDNMEDLVVNDNIVQQEDLAKQATLASVVLNVEEMMAELHDSPIVHTPSDILPIQPLSQSQSIILNRTDLVKSTLLTKSPIKSNSLPSTKNTEELAGQEYAELVQPLRSGAQPGLIDYVNINSESMSLADSTTGPQEMSIEDLNLTTAKGSSSNSEEPLYCEFNTYISLTSTQSPIAK
ncbi:uncharacterized protein cav isoform X2 [Eurosta solidaginis]